MKTYILLFRGINVGGKNLMPMKALKATLDDLGYLQVKTYIQSGNVVLNSDECPNEMNIKQAIEVQFGFSPEMLVLDIAAFEAAVKKNPYLTNEGKTIHMFFLSNQPLPDNERLRSLASKTEQYHLEGQVFYLYAPDGIGRSKLASKVESCLQVTATGRNLNTVNKLMAMSAD